MNTKLHLLLILTTCISIHSMEKPITKPAAMPEGLAFPIQDIWLNVIARSCCKWKLRNTCRYFYHFASIANDKIFLQNPLVMEQDFMEQYALYYAALNDGAIICNLLSQGLDPNLHDNEWFNRKYLLDYAFNNRNMVMINALLNHPQIDLKFAFSYLLRYGFLEIAQNMLTTDTIDILLGVCCGFMSDKNADLLTHILSLKNDAETLSGLLKNAICNGHVKIARILLDNNAQVNVIRDDIDPTPLHMALNHLPMLKLLLEYGADINRLDDCDVTPLEQAIQCQNLKATQLLLNHGAYLDTQKTFLIDMIGSIPNIQLIKLLLNKGVNINAKDQYNNTALSVAVHYRRTEVIPLLLAHPDIDVNPINNFGRTPLDIAIKERNDDLYPQSKDIYDDIIQLLIKHGAKKSIFLHHV